MKPNALVSQVDLLASLSQLVCEKKDVKKDAIDSKNLLPVLIGKSKEGRTHLIEEAFTMSLRSGNWMYIASFSGIAPNWLKNKMVASGLQQTAQLYNLEDDPKENCNLINRYPDILKKMTNTLNDIIVNK